MQLGVLRFITKIPLNSLKYVVFLDGTTNLIIALRQNPHIYMNSR